MSRTAKPDAARQPWPGPPTEEIRVLLVEADRAAAARTLDRLNGLRQPACRVRHVGDPAQAAHALATADYTAILLGAADSLRQNLARFDSLSSVAPHTPIIVLSAHDDEVFYGEIVEHGALDCLVVAETDDRALRRVLRYAEGSQRARRHIAWLTNFDGLTELPNRDVLRARLRDSIAQAKAAAEARQFAVLMVNLDRFKLINETLGPNRGDRLLQEVGNRLRGCLGESDLIARYGGDEFVALCSGLAAPADATITAQKMINSLSRPMLIEGHEVFVTGSIGISVFPADGSDPDVLISNADAAVMRAKDLGRNLFQFYTLDMNSQATRRLSLEADLRRAIAQDELVLHYQPQFDLARRRVTGFEALVRWQHPEMGLLPPNEFIPLAEETGLIAPLGEWVIRQACAQGKLWHGDGYPDMLMAVNLSSRQFFKENVLDMVTRVLAETDFPANCLELELTESCVMENPDEAITTLRWLHDRGVRIAIDDFGTGHSSLNQLKRFPIDCIKIDRSFINDVTINPEDGAIVQAVLAMAQGLKLDVVAEGVETIEQLRFLESFGCNLIQGYLVSRPLTADQTSRTFLPPSGMSPEILPFGPAAAGAAKAHG